mmetsp:Transcript_69640/g.213505  ORF Transcript_69640/g.213505 Transcript_69640/m.213505 type:complete len:218 (+) Transcript_69640:303-956(+)
MLGGKLDLHETHDTILVRVWDHVLLLGEHEVAQVAVHVFQCERQVWMRRAGEAVAFGPLQLLHDLVPHRPLRREESRPAVEDRLGGPAESRLGQDRLVPDGELDQGGRPIVRYSHRKPHAPALEHATVNAAPEGRVRVVVVGRVVKAELVFIQHLLLDDVVEERLDAVGGHRGEGQAQDALDGHLIPERADDLADEAEDLPLDIVARDAECVNALHA